MADPTTWWTVAQACTQWGVSRTTLNRWMTARLVRSTTLLGRRLIDPNQPRPEPKPGRPSK